MKVITYQQYLELVSKTKLTLLTSQYEYINQRQIVKFKCSCGEIFKLKAARIKNGVTHCPNCSYKIRNKKNTYNTIETESNKYLKAGIEIISINDNVFTLKCKCSNIFNRTFGSKRFITNCSDCTKVKREQTMIKKFGVKHPLQNADIFERVKYKFHEYITPSGKVIKLQGYEPKCLDLLLETYSEDEIFHKKTDVPEIWYVGLDNKKHRYYPDFYIPKDNLIIETKSTYTYEVDLEVNLLKQQACVAAGFSFEFNIL